jgi:protein phosphatase
MMTRVAERLGRLYRRLGPWRGAGRRPLCVTARGASDVGRVRAENEDAWLIERFQGAGMPPATLLLVADGMGGAAAGEVASSMATEIVSARLGEFFRMAYGAPADRLAAVLTEAFDVANARIHDAAGRDATLSGMGTTATAVLVVDDLVHVGHVGDTRACLLRGGHLTRLTRDHSLLQHLVDSGELTRAQGVTSRQRNALLRALGTQPSVTTDVATHRVRGGDTILLCSDGLWSALADEDIAGLVAGDDPAVACAALVDAANARDGRDNVTVVIARLSVEGAEVPGTDTVLAIEPNRA